MQTVSIIGFEFLALLMGLWSRPNFSEMKSRFAHVISFLIFAPLSVLFSYFAWKELNLFCLVPLIFGFVSAHSFEKWLKKEISTIANKT